jgi:glycosyltransferase involved in cell wall biosynthesis
MKLFIYVPTYNRPKALRSQLASLAEQAAKYKERVRILVSDNASPNDAYAGLVEEFSADSVCFRKNPANIGGNANIALGFVFAHPDEFLWILSDNDFVAPGAIEFILEHLSEEVDFVSLTPQAQEIETIVQHWADGYSGIVVRGSVGLISLVVYNVKSIAPYIHTAFSFHNSSFPHLAVMLATIRGRSTVNFKSLPYDKVFRPRPDDDGSPGDYSLSAVGMPLLAPLLTRQAAKHFCAYWLLANGTAFRVNRSKHRSVYVQTLATLRKYGGFRTLVLLFWIWVPYLHRLAKGFVTSHLKERRPHEKKTDAANT